LSKKALITGITGQDGSYLAELLLTKGYEVHGIIRRSSSFNTERIDHLYMDRHVHGVKLFLHYGDLSDSASLMRLLHDLQPDEVYHLGAQSHVRVSFDVPEGAFLPGFEQRDVWPGARGAATRGHAVLPAQPLRSGEGLRVLDDSELPRKLPDARQQWHSL
jgi:hypothetical protein